MCKDNAFSLISSHVCHMYGAKGFHTSLILEIVSLGVPFLVNKLFNRELFNLRWAVPKKINIPHSLFIKTGEMSFPLSFLLAFILRFSWDSS